VDLQAEAARQMDADSTEDSDVAHTLTYAENAKSHCAGARTF